MRLEKQMNLRHSGKSRAAAIIDRARRECLSQSAMLAELNANVARLPEFPRSIRHDVRTFAEGYREAVIRADVVCMYCVDGALYRLTNESSPELAKFPAWDALPRDRWSDMPSALYWVNGGEPRLFFKSEG